MAKRFRIEDHPQGKKICISAALFEPARGLFHAMGLLYLLGVAGFAYTLLYSWNESIGAQVVAVLAIIAFSIACYRFSNRASLREELLITRDQLIITTGGWWHRRTYTFFHNAISNLKWLPDEPSTPHPLQGASFDYLGFGSEQAIIQELHQEGRIIFDYEGRKVRFGADVTSWEFNELEVALYEITGNDYRYTDSFEAQHFRKEN